jgi:hypothetical protein
MSDFQPDTSDSIDKIMPALVAIQAELEAVAIDSNNPHFKSRYASLSSVIDTARPVCTKHGVAILQFPRTDGDMVGVTTRLIHTSGQWVAGSASVRLTKGGPQDVGSIVTYMRRYTLTAMLCLSQDDDDDGGNAGQKAAQASPQRNSPGPDPALQSQVQRLVRARGITTAAAYAEFCRGVIGKTRPDTDADRRKLIAHLEAGNAAADAEPEEPPSDVE